MNWNTNSNFVILLLTLFTLFIINMQLEYSTLSTIKRPMYFQPQKKHKLILRYPKFYEKWKCYKHWGDKIFDTDKETETHWCKDHVCTITNNKSRLAEADAVLVHLGDLPEHPDMWLPQDYKPAASQKWIAYWNEAPQNKPCFPKQDNLSLPWQRTLDGVFDWTASYRTDADFQIGYIRNIYQKKWFFKNKSFNREKILKLKDKTALWVVSHCKTISKREDYVESLRSHLNITLKGRCYSHDTKNRDMDAFQDKEHYYFYLSFENSLCDDYITEKFMNMLKHNIVPVVMGAPKRDYERIAPPNSFIHISDFNSTLHLAQYLTHLQNNPDEYMEYLEWKKYYKKGNSQDWLCDLCTKLYDQQDLQLSNQMKNVEATNETKGVEPSEEMHGIQTQHLIQDFLGLWNQRKCYGHDYSYNSYNSE